MSAAEEHASLAIRRIGPRGRFCRIEAAISKAGSASAVRRRW